MRKKRPFEAHFTWLSFMSSAPPLLLSLWLMFYADASIGLIILTTLLGSILIGFTHHQIHQKLVYQFRSLSHLLDALAQDDYAQRVHSDKTDGELNELTASTNGLGQLPEPQTKTVSIFKLFENVFELFKTQHIIIGPAADTQSCIDSIQFVAGVDQYRERFRRGNVTLQYRRSYH